MLSLHCMSTHSPPADWRFTGLTLDSHWRKIRLTLDLQRRYIGGTTDLQRTYNGGTTEVQRRCYYDKKEIYPHFFCHFVLLFNLFSYICSKLAKKEDYGNTEE